MSDSADTQLSTEQLVASAKQGCASSFSELVRRHEAPLYRFLLMRTRDPEQAEELCQQSFVRCWHKLHTFRVGAPFTPWLFTLARRVASNHFRRRAERPLEDAGDPASGALGPHDLMAVREEAAQLWDLAARLLDENQRSALWLHYAEGLTAREVGAVLGRPAAQVRVLLHRARRRLEEHLDASRPTEPAQASEPVRKSTSSRSQRAPLNPSAWPTGELL